MEIGSVVAVVVTFNRKVMLLQNIRALKSQTRALDKIVIIDNASTDGTPEALRSSGILDDPQIAYFRSERNTGGAGGFRAGMQRAMDAGAVWLWIMDDDVAPAPECLATLLTYTDVSECIHPRKIFANGTEYPSERFYDVLTGGSYAVDNLSFKNGKSIIYNNTATFEGLLVSKRIVEKVGLPDERYFICGDDLLFALKASVHTNISHVRDAILHKLVNPSNDFPAWREYYSLRNRFFVYRDACEYLGLKPHFSEKVKFFVIQVLEVLRISAKGFSHCRSAVSAFVDGIKYMRSARVVPSPE